MVGSWKVLAPSLAMLPLVGPFWGNATAVPAATVAELSGGMRAKNSEKTKAAGGPVAPAGPAGPMAPVAPMTPATPFRPLGPRRPTDPVGLGLR